MKPSHASLARVKMRFGKSSILVVRHGVDGDV